MPDPQQQTFTDVQPIAQTFSNVTPINSADSGFLTEAPKDITHPVMAALAQEGLGDLNEAEAKAKFGQDHPWITAIGDTLATFPAFLPSLAESLAKNGFMATLRASIPAMAKRSALGAGIGGGIGAAFGQGKIGAATGAVSGAISGFGDVPLTVEQQAQRSVAGEIARKAARVQAGLEPPSGDTIAETLRQEFLNPPKKSGIPLQISSPAAKTPTYVPQGIPGAPPVEAAPKTIGQIARERVAQATQKAGQKALQQTADIEAGVKQAPEESAPVSMLSEGPTAALHQVARQNALEDIRDATINRPGWVAKLPDRQTFSKLSASSQRAVINQAIVDDPEATKAIVQSGRVESAGDLTQWKAEDLWAGYMRNRGTTLGNAINGELERRGLVTSKLSSVRVGSAAPNTSSAE